MNARSFLAILALAILGLASCQSDRQTARAPETTPDLVAILQKTTWISDKPATVHWIEIHRPNLMQRQRLLDLFGRMTIAFAPGKVTTHMDGKTYVRDDKTLGQTTREVASLTYDASLKRDVIVITEIDADGNGWWIYNSEFDIKEHFIPFNPPADITSSSPSATVPSPAASAP